MIKNDLVCLIHKEDLQHKIQDKQGVWKVVCIYCTELNKSGILNYERADSIQHSFQYILNLQNDNHSKLQNLKHELISLKQKIEKFTELIDQQNELYDQQIQQIRNNIQSEGEMSLQQKMKQINNSIMQTKDLLQKSVASIFQSSQLQKISQDIDNLRLFDESQIENNNQQNDQQNKFNLQNVQQLKFGQQQQNILQQQNNLQIQDLQQQQNSQQFQVIDQQQQIQKTKKCEPQKDKEQEDQEQFDVKKTIKIDKQQNSSDNHVQHEIDQTQKIQPKQDINQTQKIEYKNNTKQPQNENQQSSDQQKDSEKQLIQDIEDSDIQNQSPTQEKVLQINKLQGSDNQNKSPTQEKVLQINTLATIKQQENCWALAFNNNSQKLAVGFNENIKIFQIIDGVQLKEDQILLGHTSNVSCIYFLNGSDNIISASYDYTIKIWEQDQYLRYNNTQTLSEHLGFIQSLQVSQRDNLIISGSQDGSIKFWKFDKIWSCKQTLDTFANNIYCLSLNDAEYKLIASVNCSKPEILVIEQSSDSKWYLQQRIHLENTGFRLCFIDNNTFTFQPNDHKNILTFTYNENSSEFTQKEESYKKDSSVDSGGLFPQQFIKSKQLLITKQVGQIIILRKYSQKFQVEQSIKFVNEHGLYGTLNKDGNLLALWSLSESELQLRRLED